jgi:hypothetical protein
MKYASEYGSQVGSIKKSPDQMLIRGRPFFLVSWFGVLRIATGSNSFQAGLLTPGSLYLLRLPNYFRQ